jgi:hypothetical protein
MESIAVDDMMAEAIQFCIEKTGLQTRDEVLETVQMADCWICEYLRYGLAKGLAAYLGSVDDAVRAVYSYDPERATGAEGGITSPGISLIVWASRRSAALSSVANLLTSAVAAERDGLGCPKSDALCLALDVQIVDDAQVESRCGYGALIRSLYVRPVEIWRR